MLEANKRDSRRMGLTRHPTPTPLKRKKPPKGLPHFEADRWTRPRTSASKQRRHTGSSLDSDRKRYGGRPDLTSRRQLPVQPVLGRPSRPALGPLSTRGGGSHASARAHRVPRRNDLTQGPFLRFAVGLGSRRVSEVTRRREPNPGRGGFDVPQRKSPKQTAAGEARTGFWRGRKLRRIFKRPAAVVYDRRCKACRSI